MTKTIIAIASSAIFLGGCGAQYANTYRAIQPEPRTSIVDMSQSFAHPNPTENPFVRMCRPLSEFAVTAVEQRQSGLSQEQSKQIVAMASIIGMDDPTSIEGKMTGAAMFMVIERVYTNQLTTANAKSDIFNWCMRENVPLVVYIAATR